MIDPKELLIELRPEEVILIMAIRNKFRYGPVQIFVRDGIPQRVEQVTVYVDLKERDSKRLEDMLN
jgi:hypothetical protein